MGTKLAVVAGQHSPLESLAQDYIEDRRAAGLSVRSVEGDIRVRLERIFLPWCRDNGVTDPEELDQRTINRFSTHLLDEGGAKGQPLSPHSVAAYMKTTNAFLNWLREHADRKPAGRGHKPKLPKREVELLTDAEVKAMIRKASGRDALIVQLLAESGIRVGELVGLRVNDLVEHDVVLLNGTREHQKGIRVIGKGNVERFVPIPPDLHQRLRGLARTRPLDARGSNLFVAERRSSRSGYHEPLTVSGVQQLVRWLGRNAIGRPVHPHLFRHTYISKLVRKGVDTTVIRRYVGHSSSVLIDQVYGHMRPQHTAALVLAALRD
jgi:integrase/recombinase XerC